MSRLNQTNGGAVLVPTMLSQDYSYFENSLDPDQLASEKSANQHLHCFPFCFQIHANEWNHVC